MHKITIEQVEGREEVMDPKNDVSNTNSKPACDKEKGTIATTSSKPELRTYDADTIALYELLRARYVR